MAITYTIDKSGRWILEVWTGTVSAEELGNHWRRITTDANALAIRATLADLREADFEFTGDELFDLIRGIAEPMLNGLQWRSALLVQNALQFGVSRQYQALAEVYSQDAIFQDEDAALEWLLRGTD